MKFLYILSKTICHIFFRTFNRLEVIGAENVPARGGVIVASNHASYLDPPLLGVALKRRPTYLAKEGLFTVPLLGTFIQMFSLPVRRENPQPSAIKAVLRRLQEGELVVIFPEGGRSVDGSLQPAKRGIGVLIALSGAPVVPVFLKGTDRALPVNSKLPKPSKIKVVFGKPMLFDKEIAGKRLHEQMSTDIIEAIRDLKAVVDANNNL
ncbi:MAG: lysophospholipid acyltransferase family protein [Nitrospirota bacterium]